MTPRPKAPAKLKISEAAFQKQVLTYAALTGWRSAHFRTCMNARGDYRTAVAGDGKGFPDLVLVRDRVIYAELKRDGEKLRPDQELWRDALTAAGAEWHMWTPAQWDDVIAALKRRPPVI